MFFRRRQTLLNSDSVLPQSIHKFKKNQCRNGRMSLCISLKAGLTVEASLTVPFFLLVLLAFFGFFGRYSKMMELRTAAAAEAKMIAVVQGASGIENAGKIIVQKSAKTENFWEMPFEIAKTVKAKAVCRAWIGFRGLEQKESFVYITPEGAVYHLYSDCTHLQLSVRKVSFAYAKKAKNMYGERYRSCERCGEKKSLTKAPEAENPSVAVYITEEGECYHPDRTCSGLKRTVLTVPMSGAAGRSCCDRCLKREGEIG